MRFLTDGSCDFAIVRVPAGRLPRGGGGLDWGRPPRAPGPGRGHLRLRGETHGPAGRPLRLARVRRGAPPAERKKDIVLQHPFRKAYLSTSLTVVEPLHLALAPQ
jgi:hypothetical protein